MDHKGSMIFLAFFAIFWHFAVEAEKPVCLITAPTTVHLGVEETVSVQLHGATEDVQISLYFKGSRDPVTLSEKKVVTLNSNNRYQAVETLKINPEQYHKDEKQPESVVLLVAEHEHLFASDGGKKMVHVFLSTKRGYLFIQTDKPIYNPGETANYRIFTLDNYMRPLNDVIDVKVFNCKDLLVFSRARRSQQISNGMIKIPDVEQAGHWKIVATFAKYPESSSSAEFEIREYVLPTFEVNIEASKPYHTLNSESFPFSISARYTYGKGVNGIAYVRFGLVDSKGERTYLPGTEKQITVENGSASVSFLTAELQRAFSEVKKEPDPLIEGLYLYIAATVLEKASGDLEEAESSSVKIVSSPYVIDLSRTKKYFTPGGMFSILGTTTYPDGSRAPRLKIGATIRVDGQEVLVRDTVGDETGNMAITFQVPVDAKTVSMMVTAKGEDEDVIVSDAKITSEAIKPERGRYLSVEVQNKILQPGENLQVIFRDISPAGTAKPSHIYYLVLSKGRVLQVDRVQRTDLTSINLLFSFDMVPSFRLLAYYYIEQEGSRIVADSVWVDVRDVCKAKVEIAPFAELKPAQQFEVTVKTDKDSKVALAAVDSAVYILNKKNKLSPKKMFEYMNSYDLGCSVGGGEDSKSVLESVGLTFICNCHTETSPAAEHKCLKSKLRLKRSSDYSAIFNSFKHADRKCCDDGRKRGLMRLSCDERLKRTTHQTPSCRQAFKKCCDAGVALRRQALLEKKKQSLGRTVDNRIEDELDEALIHLRSYFPQSWMWVTLDSDGSGDVRHSAIAPDSITTWEVQAVGLSPTNGFCIANPEPLRVFQDFFVSVKLPYSVKRNEQLEIKAVLYNYKEKDLEVTVKMEKVEGLCSAGGGNMVEKVLLPAQNAASVYFSVVPLVIRKIPIDVLAYASAEAQDRIVKELRVVGEGELVTIDREANLDAKTDKNVEIEIPEPEDEVVGDVSSTTMSFKGGVMGESANNCLNLEGVDKLILLPTGCAEQTMVKMSPAIQALQYLDATNQWLYLKAERREEAQAMVQEGYSRVLTFKKEDGSYGAFLTRPSSIWLTAFIAKELTASRDIIDVQDSYIKESVSYLISKQKDNGAWDDPNPLYDRGMKGGVGQTDDDTPLTAYVLLSMKHAQQVYEVGEGTALRMAMEKAKSYLVQRLDKLQSPYATAITAYALSLNDAESSEAQQAHTKLMRMATCESNKCFWIVNEKVKGVGGKADAITVETASYGLLHAVTMQDKRRALKIATWLTEQRKFGGGFRSTQDTVIALEALSRFSIQNNDVEELNLRVVVCVNNERTQNVHLTRKNALTHTPIQVKDFNKVSLSVTGQGKGTLTIVKTYRSLKKDDSYCDHFHLSVALEGELQLQSQDEEVEQYEDYYGGGEEEYGDKRDEPMSRMDWYDLRTRRKRQAPQEPKKESRLVYTVCLRQKKGPSSGMVVVDVSLLSGLTPVVQDLEDNAKGTERYIDHYDVHHNKVFLYFNEVTETEECLRFRAEQIIPIGLVQPAAAVMYDYYNPDRRCGIFYSAPKNSPMLAKLCQADVCMCAEGSCPRLKVTFSKNMQAETRRNYACFAQVVDFVYAIKVLNSSNDGVFTSYTTLVTNVLQTGRDSTINKDSVREMFQRSSCDQFEMKIDANYLIMGKDEGISEAERRFRYILTNAMWIEEMPPKRKCKATVNRRACQLLENFMGEYFLNQCAI